MAGFRISMLSIGTQIVAGRYADRTLVFLVKCSLIFSELHSAQSLAEQGFSKGPPPDGRTWQGYEMANRTRVSRRVLEETSSQRHSSFFVCAYLASFRRRQGY